MARRKDRSKKRRMSAMMSISGSALSRLCIRTAAAPVSATVSAIAGSLLQTPHIIDDAGAEFDRAAGDLGLGGIDRKRNIDGACQLAKNGIEAGELLLGAHRRMTRAGRFGAHIDNIGALEPEFFRLLHGGIQAQEFAAVGKGIRRDIQYAHDEGPCAQEPEKAVAAPNAGGTIDAAG